MSPSSPIVPEDILAGTGAGGPGRGEDGVEKDAIDADEEEEEGSAGGGGTK